MSLLTILAGAALLIFGRQLYWLFVGAIGFVVAFDIAAVLLRGQPEWLILIIALAAGILGALIALGLQQLAIGVAGFLAGGYVAASLLGLVGLEAGLIFWACYLVGGVVGAVFVLAAFDWALIILSSTAGAMVIARALHPNPMFALLLFVALFVIGVAIQATTLRREQYRQR